MQTKCEMLHDLRKFVFLDGTHSSVLLPRMALAEKLLQGFSEGHCPSDTTLAWCADDIDVLYIQAILKD